MNEININGEIYVKKSEIKIDSEIIFENLKTGAINLYDLTEPLKNYIEAELEGGEWFDEQQLLGNHSSSKLQLAMLYRCL